MVGQLPLEQPIGVRIPGGQPNNRFSFRTLRVVRKTFFRFPALRLRPVCVCCRHFFGSAVQSVDPSYVFSRNRAGQVDVPSAPTGPQLDDEDVEDIEQAADNELEAAEEQILDQATAAGTNGRADLLLRVHWTVSWKRPEPCCPGSNGCISNRSTRKLRPS
jgi:hypothetical protein